MTEPTPEQRAEAIIENVAMTFQVEAYANELRDAISAAIKSAESDERERCCKAVCVSCVDGLEVDHDERGYFHVSNQGEYRCRASGIKSLGEK